MDSVVKEFRILIRQIPPAVGMQVVHAIGFLMALQMYAFVWISQKKKCVVREIWRYLLTTRTLDAFC